MVMHRRLIGVSSDERIVQIEGRKAGAIGFGKGVYKRAFVIMNIDEEAPPTF